MAQDGKGGKPPGGFDMDENALTRRKGPKRAPAGPKPAAAPAAPVSAEGLPPGVTPELIQAVLKAQEQQKKKAAAQKPQQPRFVGPAITVNSQGLLRLNPKAATQTDTQKKMAKSKFEGKASFDRLLGGQPQAQDDSEPTNSVSVKAPVPTFDGSTPAPSVTARDPWKAVLAPALSKEGQRSADTYLNVLRQFAVATNPRYEPDAPGKLRAHIFACDVTRAMGCELPRFLGAREVSLGLLVDWIRSEGLMHGWRRISPQDALAAAQAGQPAVVIPKDPRVKMMALVMPVPAGPDGLPRFASAGAKRGYDLSLRDALGVFAAEYLGHG